MNFLDSFEEVYEVELTAMLWSCPFPIIFLINCEFLPQEQESLGLVKTRFISLDMLYT